MSDPQPFDDRPPGRGDGGGPPPAFWGGFFYGVAVSALTWVVARGPVLTERSNLPLCGLLSVKLVSIAVAASVPRWRPAVAGILLSIGVGFLAVWVALCA